MTAETATTEKTSPTAVVESAVEKVNTDDDKMDVVVAAVENRYVKTSSSSNNNKESNNNNNMEEEEEESTTVEKKSTTTTNNTNTNAVIFTPELLQMYYMKLFPFNFLYRWLSYGSTALFNQREFSFTIEPIPGEEIYIRYQSFMNENELIQSILKRRPNKIDIGAIFTHPPKDKNTVMPASAFQPYIRELVFDIDLTDYDDIRKCGCTNANICNVCWKYMNMAVKIMDAGLREDFDFHHIAWFYSGRRGIHCWVCDDHARTLTDHGRAAVAEYFEVTLGNDKNKNNMNITNPLHPMLERSYDILEPMFIEYVLPKSGHGLLASENEWNKLLETLPGDAGAQVRDNLLTEWSTSKSTPVQKWNELKKHIRFCIKGRSSSGGNNDRNSNKAAKTASTKELEKLELWCTEIVFQHTYPRLDINVSKMRNHLLKSPFCIHPKTGRVCVPIHDIDNFNPFTVPTVSQLIQELDEYNINENEDTKKNTDWSKTSLKEYFESFEKNFLLPLEKEIRQENRNIKEEQAAIIGDF